MAIGQYPEFSPLTLAERPVLHPRFQQLAEGMSELTFAGIYLFRDVHHYAVAAIDEQTYVISGRDAEPFFMLPFSLPDRGVLDQLFEQYGSMKCVSAAQAGQLSNMGYRVSEDRDNFDYLYRREDLVQLPGRKLHRKKNLVNLFLRSHTTAVRPLLDQYAGDAMSVLEAWNEQHEGPGDYAAAREALEQMEYLQLCGGIFYVDGKPAAYSLGEELAGGAMWVVHFEKAVLEDQYKGIYQYVNRAFVSLLPEKYETINREQDLGDPGLRQAKESYRPSGFVRKYRAAR